MNLGLAAEFPPVTLPPMLTVEPAHEVGATDDRGSARAQILAALTTAASTPEETFTDNVCL